MKKIIALIISCVLITVIVISALSAAAWENPFSDVRKKDWYYDAVKFAYENNIVNGTSKTTFSPNDSVTRAMFVTMLARFDDVPEDKNAVSSFADVKKGAYYCSYVTWAHKNGIVNGVGANRFSPNDPITRQDMCVILQRFTKHISFDLKPVKDKISFSDEKKISSYAKEAVETLSRSGIIEGINGAFVPGGISTRAQAATVLMRLSGLMSSHTDESITLTDGETGITVTGTKNDGITESTSIKINSIEVKNFPDLELVYAIEITLTSKEDDILLKGPVSISIPITAEEYKNNDYYTVDGNDTLKKMSPISDDTILITTEKNGVIFLIGRSNWSRNY